MTTDSDEILLKKRARRRLVGAVVFASVVAIVLPMLMDENPNPKIDDVLVRIPPPTPRPNPPHPLWMIWSIVTLRQKSGVKIRPFHKCRKCRRKWVFQTFPMSI